MRCISVRLVTSAATIRWFMGRNHELQTACHATLSRALIGAQPSGCFNADFEDDRRSGLKAALLYRAPRNENSHLPVEHLSRHSRIVVNQREFDLELSRCFRRNEPRSIVSYESR